MKTLIICIAVALIGFNVSYAQDSLSRVQPAQDTTEVKPHRLVVVIKHNGTEYVGELVSKDAREVLMKIEGLGEVYIPTHEIKEIRDLKEGDISSSGEYIPDEVFATRYYITTNGLPIKRGEHYATIYFYGPDVQFAVADRFGVGIMTTWIGTPLIGTFKYTLSHNDQSSLAIGGLFGANVWDFADGIRGGLPFLVWTAGNRKANFSISGGYGFVSQKYYNYDWNTNSTSTGRSTEGKAMFSVAFMAKMSKKMSFVFDSILVPGNDNSSGLGYLIPSFRFQGNPKSAFQFGFGGIFLEGGGFPFPSVQWFRALN